MNFAQANPNENKQFINPVRSKSFRREDAFTYPYEVYAVTRTAKYGAFRRWYYLGEMSLLNRRQGNSTSIDVNGSVVARAGAPSVATVLKALRIHGQISAFEDMYIDTEIYGPIVSDSSVTIGPNGSIHGEVKGRQIVIFGRVEGNIEAMEKVALGEGADVRGDIYTFYISLDDKAYFRGRIDCSPLDTQARRMPPASESRDAARESLTA